MTRVSKEHAVAPRTGAGREAALFVITRDDPVDDGLARGAAEYGYRVARLALLATEPGAQSATLERLLASGAPGTACAWTSRRAAKALVRAFSSDGSQATPAGRAREGRGNMPLYALGKESAAPAREAGLKVRTPKDALGASQLADYVAGRAGTDGVRRVLFLHGNHALPDFPDGLRKRGIEVAPVEVYRTTYLSPDVSDLKSALQRGATVAAAFFSPTGVEALERLLTGMELERLRAGAIALARGATTHETLRSRGYRNASYPQGTIFFHPFGLEALRIAMKERA